MEQFHIAPSSLYNPDVPNLPSLRHSQIKAKGSTNSNQSIIDSALDSKLYYDDMKADDRRRALAGEHIKPPNWGDVGNVRAWLEQRWPSKPSKTSSGSPHFQYMEVCYERPSVYPYHPGSTDCGASFSRSEFFRWHKAYPLTIDHNCECRLPLYPDPQQIEDFPEIKEESDRTKDVVKRKLEAQRVKDFNDFKDFNMSVMSSERKAEQHDNTYIAMSGTQLKWSDPNCSFGDLDAAGLMIEPMWDDGTEGENLKAWLEQRYRQDNALLGTPMYQYRLESLASWLCCSGSCPPGSMSLHLTFTEFRRLRRKHNGHTSIHRDNEDYVLYPDP